MTDHTPSPATDGLREAIEALRAEQGDEDVRLTDGEREELQAACCGYPLFDAVERILAARLRGLDGTSDD